MIIPLTSKVSHKYIWHIDQDYQQCRKKAILPAKIVGPVELMQDAYIFSLNGGDSAGELECVLQCATLYFQSYLPIEKHISHGGPNGLFLGTGQINRVAKPVNASTTWPWSPTT